MNNKNLPTMFIDTISTKIENNNSQVYYDTRYKKNGTKWETKKTTTVIEKKLDGILNLVNKGNTINVYLELDESCVEGILKERRNDQLVILIYNKEEIIDISKIKDVIILNN